MNRSMERSMTERDVPRALLDPSAELNRKAIGKLVLIDRADEQAATKKH